MDITIMAWRGTRMAQTTKELQLNVGHSVTNCYVVEDRTASVCPFVHAHVCNFSVMAMVVVLVVCDLEEYECAHIAYQYIES